MNVYTKENAVKTLETYMNNKNYFEKIRSGEVQLNDDFINYANQ
jgi:hypothetical protein